MKYIYVTEYFSPELGYFETYLPREQARLGHDVCVVTSDRHLPPVYRAGTDHIGDDVRKAGLSIEEGIKVWRLKTLFEVPHTIWMRGLENKLQELNPDIVHVGGIASLTAIRIAGLKNKKRGFKLIYNSSMTSQNSRSKLRVLYPLFKWLFSPSIQKAADALVAVIPESKTFMHEIYGIPLQRIAVIPLGADIELFRFDPSARREIRDNLSISENDVVFIYTGKITPVKRLHVLIEAAAKLIANNADIKVMLVGSGAQSYIAELKQAIKTKGLEGKFIWHDAVPNEQLHRYYSAADAAVWPYGPSISMREAMSCGLPIVIGENSAVTELVAYSNGLTYHEEDAADLARQMEKLIDPELRREMGGKSRKLVEDRFSWRRIAEQFIELVTGQQA